MANEKVKILDTTLRDGEQSAGIGMTVEEKMEIAKQLEKLQVDIIEAGFAASSPGDFQAVENIAKEVRSSVICSLSRAHPNDVDQAWGAIKQAESPRIHVFLSSSEIQVLHQLRKNREEVMDMAVAMVTRAKSYCDDVEFSPMDATRTNPEYLYKMLEAVIKAGATTINIADTVGYAIPSNFAELITDIRNKIPGIEKTTLSVHCHNDLGLAVSNTLAAIQAGVRQVEGCINGLGERAGNASLEEIIMGLDTRKDLFNIDCNIDTTQLYPTSRLVSRITGMAVQANKAIVGENAFRHASGIHQDGVLKDRSTYEVMQPERVGVPGNSLVLGKLSGRAGLQSRLEALGYFLEREELNNVFESFKVLADKKREVNDKDLEILMDEEKRVSNEPITYSLDQVHFSSGDHDIPTATVRLIGPDNTQFTDASTGNGPVDAVCKAIDRVIGTTCKLIDFNVQSVTEGLDSQGTVTIRIENNDQVFSGRGANTDIIVASAEAYLSAVNRMIANDDNYKMPALEGTPD
ncbi:MAG: 2-isopropylmalate synthase [SAR202 cluster bacterium]|nr:2-isopropylmalate synthase [SAR202 cluster bacterium]MQG35229.1 2-isopropylmalate synthase [SAR202 cluster bacterium]MQG86056.1 2-isopropylmalate synthase [SAR202 cluster bacterium]|tara:strand:- start:22664 stop:24223 length:1560 start_codon:yes stop_codon:yes gene_type:complete